MGNDFVVNLEKGTSVNLNKVNEGISLKKNTSGKLSNIHIGLGWDVHSRVQADLDAFVVQVDANNNIIDTVYFGHRTSNDKAIYHTGDNLTGAGEGDDEVIYINLDKLSANTHRLGIAVNIFQCRTTFDDIQNAFIRLLNKDTNEVLAQYDLSNEFNGSYAMIMGEITKNPDGTWDFTAVGMGTKDRNVKEVAKRFANGNFESQPYQPSQNTNQNINQNTAPKTRKKFFGLF